jgi:hypothetical protein
MDQSELVLAVEKRMKATLNGCNLLQEVKVGDLLTARHELPAGPTVSTSIPSNDLKRPASDSALEGQSMIKMTPFAQDKDSILEKTVMSPTSKAIKEMHSCLGESALESRQSRILNFCKRTAEIDTGDAPKQRRERPSHLPVCCTLRSGNPVPVAESAVRAPDHVDHNPIREKCVARCEARMMS